MKQGDVDAVTGALSALEDALQQAGGGDADAAALEGAEIVSGWDATDGGWSTGFRAVGSRLAACGYQLASVALNVDEQALSPLSGEDLAVDGDGQFTGERFGQVQSALVSAELSIGTQLMETLVLAFEVAFEAGVRRALLDAQVSSDDVASRQGW